MVHKGEDLYKLYAKAVYRYLFSLIGEADTAEELTQETFCQALKSIDTYRGESTPQVWLCAIAKRTVLVGESDLSRVAAPDDPAKEYEAQQERFALYRAMQKLDAETREVIHLRLAGDFSFRDIGEILGHSEVWARVRFYRGKEELVKIIGGDNHV